MAFIVDAQSLTAENFMKLGERIHRNHAISDAKLITPVGQIKWGAD